MEKKKVLPGMLIIVLALGMTVVGCDNGSTNGDENNVSITGTWNNDSNHEAIIINGNEWIVTNYGRPFMRGTWVSNPVIVSFPSSATVILTITKVYDGNNWIAPPSEISSVLVNSALIEVNAGGNKAVISNALHKTDGVWATLEGNYSKQYIWPLEQIYY